MAYSEIDIKLRTGYSDEELRQAVEKRADSGDFSYHIIGKSLDARKKGNIHWQIRVAVLTGEEKNRDIDNEGLPVIPFCGKNKRVVIAGSGPAGMFAALVLQKAGFSTILLERGADIDNRVQGLRHFEKTGQFNPLCNYPFGEGGAGTFSDGKLTSRSKHISAERKLILQTYIKAGAPAEIAWLSHPHIGTDHLRRIVKKMREEYNGLGGVMYFGTCVDSFKCKSGKVVSCTAGTREFECDAMIFATGHSATDTYRMLMNAGVPFRTKNFAIGFRAEHRQEIINRAQWGCDSLPGVKAAEYRLTSDDADRPVYTFCMCPGGTVVPAAAFDQLSVVNGMSYYSRSGAFANAACVAGIHPDELKGSKVTPAEALDELEKLEAAFYNLKQSFAVPYCSISDFIKGNYTEKSQAVSSYPLGIFPYDLSRLVPESAGKAIRDGLKQFCRKIKGYDTGILLGLESKTSSPVQVLRGPGGLCEGFENLYMAGEGSGYAGGIISSAADGIKTAMAIVNKVL